MAGGGWDWCWYSSLDGGVVRLGGAWRVERRGYC